MNPASPRLATFLIVWFGFLNTELILGLLCFFLWKSAHPDAPPGSAVYFSPDLVGSPRGTLVLALAVSQYFLAWWFPLRLFRGKRTPAAQPTLNVERISLEDVKAMSQPYILRLVFLEVPALFALGWAMTEGNALLALPLLALSAIQTAACFPSESNLRRLFGIV